jgi:hypothetical protein
LSGIKELCGLYPYNVYLSKIFPLDIVFNVNKKRIYKDKKQDETIVPRAM